MAMFFEQFGQVMTAPRRLGTGDLPTIRYAKARKKFPGRRPTRGCRAFALTAIETFDIHVLKPKALAIEVFRMGLWRTKDYETEGCGDVDIGGSYVSHGLRRTGATDSRFGKSYRGGDRRLSRLP